MYRYIQLFFIYVLCMGTSVLHTQFADTLSYAIHFPATSTWGLFQSDIVGKNLAVSAAISDLKGSTIITSQGGKRFLTGKTKEIQIVPSLPQGVTYFNPLNSMEPLLVKGFVSSTITDTACQSPEVLLVDGVTTSATKTDVSSDNTSIFRKTLEERYNHMLQKQDALLQPYYKKLYDELKKPIESLESIKKEVTDTSDFFSLLFLKFAATYGNQFINADLITSVNKTYFGTDIDMSTYFKDAVFPVVMDLRSISNGLYPMVIESANGSGDLATRSGPLVRAFNKGKFVNNVLDVSSLISASPFFLPIDIQKFLETPLDQWNILANRARITELFFLYLGVLFGSNCVVGAPTYDESFCADSSCPGNSWCPIPSPCSKMSIAPFSFYHENTHYCFAQVCSKLAAAARYVYLLHDVQSQEKLEMPVQPVDTFYGMVVINESSYTITSNASIVQPGQVGMLSCSPGVDIWDIGGINEESHYKYRSLACNVIKGEESRTVELKVEETFDDSSYDPKQLYVPVVSFINGLNNTQKDVVRNKEFDDFFKVDRSMSWALVMQLVESSVEGGASTLTFNIVGLARLNPYDFPLVYRGPGLEQLGVGSYSSAQLIESPFIMYTKIVASQYDAQKWSLTSSSSIPNMKPLNPISLDPLTIRIDLNTTKTITPTSINPYYVLYNSALQHTYGSKNTLQTLLQKSMQIIKESYVTYDLFTTQIVTTPKMLFNSPVMTLFKKGSHNPQSSIMQVATTREYRLQN